MLNPYIEAWELRELVLKKEIRPREAAEFFSRARRSLIRGSVYRKLDPSDRSRRIG